MDEYQVVMAAAGMMQRVKEGLRVEWSIPATWIIGLAIGLVANIVLLAGAAAVMVTKLDAVVEAQKKDSRDIEITRNEVTRLGQAQRDTEVRLGVHRADLDRLQQHR